MESRGATSSSFPGGGNFHEISFDDAIKLIQPWYNFATFLEMRTFQFSNDQDGGKISSLVKTPGSVLK